MVSCSPFTPPISTHCTSDSVSPNRMRSTGMMAANENNDSTVESRLKSILSAI